MTLVFARSAFVMVLSAILAEVMAPSRIFVVVTESVAILVVVTAPSAIALVMMADGDNFALVMVKSDILSPVMVCAAILDPEMALAAILAEVTAESASFSVPMLPAAILVKDGFRLSIFSLVIFNLLNAMAALAAIWLLVTFPMTVLLWIKVIISL